MPGALPAAPGKGARIADWIVRILLGLAFVAAGGAKLAGAPPMVAIFDQIGIGQWFRLLTGTLEVAGGLLVLVPRTSVAGALLLACVMVGAVFTHLAVIGGNPAPALILLALSVAVLWLRRHGTVRRIDRAGRLPVPADRPQRREPYRSASHKGEKVGVENIGVDGQHAVAEPRIGLQRAVPEQLH